MCKSNFVSVYRSTAKSCDSEVKKSCKKASTRMRIGHVFRRSLSKESAGCLFGLPLAKICEGDNLPRPVMVSHFNNYLSRIKSKFSRPIQFY